MKGPNNPHPNTFLLDADVRGVEQELGHGEPLIVHADDLLALGGRPPHRLLPPLHEAAPQGGEVGQNVVARHRVLLRRPGKADTCDVVLLNATGLNLLDSSRV